MNLFFIKMKTNNEDIHVVRGQKMETTRIGRLIFNFIMYIVQYDHGFKGEKEARNTCKEQIEETC